MLMFPALQLSLALGGSSSLASPDESPLPTNRINSRTPAIPAANCSMLSERREPLAEDVCRREVPLGVDDREVHVERAAGLHGLRDHLGQRGAERAQLRVIGESLVSAAEQHLEGEGVPKRMGSEDGERRDGSQGWGVMGQLLRPRSTMGREGWGVTRKV